MIGKSRYLALAGSLMLICCMVAVPAQAAKEVKQASAAAASVQSATPLSGISSDQEKEISAATLSGDPLSLLNQVGTILVAYNCYVASDTQAASFGLPDKMVLRNMIRTALSYADEGPMTEEIFNKVYDIAEELAKNKTLGLGDDKFVDEIKGRRESAKTRQWMPFPPPPPPPMGFGFPPPPPPFFGPPMIVRPPWVRPPWARPPWARTPWGPPFGGGVVYGGPMF